MHIGFIIPQESPFTEIIERLEWNAFFFEIKLIVFIFLCSTWAFWGKDGSIRLNAKGFLQRLNYSNPKSLVLNLVSISNLNGLDVALW
jgi:hypothetical protein